MSCFARLIAPLAVAGPLVLAVLAALPALGRAATYTGTLAQVGVVWVSDDSRQPALPESEMRNSHKAFVPDLLVITAGSAIRFPNDDAFYHSIYSADGPDAFDMGFYDNGPGKVATFASPGVVSVRCHIHGTMHATVLVVDGPWAQTHADGEKYTLANVRPGSHVLHIWTAAGGEKTLTVRL